jgi:hypothetical protein
MLSPTDVENGYLNSDYVALPDFVIFATHVTGPV